MCKPWWRRHLWSAWAGVEQHPYQVRRCLRAKCRRIQLKELW